MNDITQGMKFTIDVKSGLVEMPQRAVLMKGDKNANRVSMALVDGEKAVSLEGATVTGTYVLAGIKMPLLGDVNENEATIILPDECYLSSGRYELRMHVTLGSVKRTFLFITGYVESDGEGGTLDVEGVIPNIDDIIAQYDEMRRVTQATQAAANAANEAASHAPYVGANGNWYVWNAASGSYIDSGSKAQGPVGPQGPAGAEIDATLKVPGKAADAKATGDALSSLSQQMANNYLPKTSTAADSAKLGGLAASEYATKSAINSEVVVEVEKRIAQITDSEAADMAEVISARTDEEGVTHTSLKTRIDNGISTLNGVIGEPTHKSYIPVNVTINNDMIYYVSRVDGSLIRQEQDSSSYFCSTVIDCAGKEKYKLTFRHTASLDNVIVADENDVILASYYTRDNAQSETVTDYEIITPNNAKHIYLTSSKAVGFGVKRSEIQKVYDGLSMATVIVDLSGGGDYTKLTDAIVNAVENTEIIVKPGVYDIISELGGDYFAAYDGSTFGPTMPKNSRIKFCSGAKAVCHYAGGNNAVKEFFSPINSNQGSVEYEGVEIEASNVKYCIHDEHGGEVNPYTIIFDRCNLYLDDSNNELAYSRSCIGGGFGKYGTVEVKNCVFESVGEQVGGTVSYHSSVNIADAVCHVSIHNNYFVGSDDTARVYSAYTGGGTQIIKASINNNSFGKAYMTDGIVQSRVFLNEVR